MIVRYTALLLVALTLGPGCDTTFGTLTLIQSGVETGATIVKGAPPTEEDRPVNEPSGE